MNKPIKSPIRLFGIGGASAAAPTNAIVNTPCGPMYAGPEYENYKRYEDFLTLLKTLVADVVGLKITRDEAIMRIDAIPRNVSINIDIEQGLEKLRAGLGGGGEAEAVGDIGRAMVQIGWGIHTLEYTVISVAGTVPKPPIPDAVQPVAGQPLGSGAYQRWKDS